MKCLIIGGSGFIGRVLVPLLSERGYDITVIDKNRATTEGVQSVVADVRNLDSITPYFAGQDLVVNLAAEHQDNVRPERLYFEVNVDGARNICAAAAIHGVARLIFTSSVAVYGASSDPLNEGSPHHFFNEYGRTKHQAEDVYREWLSGDPHRSLCIVRPTAVFGPGNRGNIFNLLQQIKHGPFLMIGRGDSVKSIAHVENVAAFLVHVLDQGHPYSVFNYADKPDLSVAELVAVSREILRLPPLRFAIPEWAGLLAGYTADLVTAVIRRPLPISSVRVRKFCSSSVIDSSAAMASGFVPPVSLSDGLRDMLLHHV